MGRWRVKGREGGSIPGRKLLWTWEQGGWREGAGEWRRWQVTLDGAELDLSRDLDFYSEWDGKPEAFEQRMMRQAGRPLRGCHRGWFLHGNKKEQHRGCRVWGWCPKDEREDFPVVTKEWVKGGIWWTILRRLLKGEVIPFLFLICDKRIRLHI